jgi:hypothetical protein
MQAFIKIKYLKSNEGICADDFKAEEKTTYINPESISEITELEHFKIPLSGLKIGRYFTIYMNNKRWFHCKETEFDSIIKRIQSNSLDVNGTTRSPKDGEYSISVHKG